MSVGRGKYDEAANTMPREWPNVVRHRHSGVTRVVRWRTAIEMYWCRTLGELSLLRTEGDPEPVLRAGKSLAILAYLSLTPKRRESRERIAELLWPGITPATRRHDLRQALYRLREVTPDAALIVSTGADLALGQEVMFDWQEARQALAAGDAQRAYALLSANFLESYGVPEAAEFEGWAESMRARFREARGHAGEALITAAVATGDVERALRLAEELVALNPLSERRVRLECSVLERARRPDEALARFRGFETLLAAELGDQPSQEAREYARQLERVVELPVPAETATSNPQAHSPSPPRPRRIALLVVTAAAVITTLAAAVWYRGRTPALPFAGGELYLERQLPSPTGRPAVSLHAVSWDCEQHGRCPLIARDDWPGGLPPQLTPVLETRDGTPIIRTAKVVDGDTVPITAGAANETNPRFSPDGRLLAISRGHREGGRYWAGIVVVDERGATQDVTADSRRRDEPLVWLPGAQSIALTRLENGKWSLWLTHLAGEQQDLTTKFSLPSQYWVAAAATRDGTVLAAAGGSAVWIMSLPDSTAAQVDFGAEIRSLVFSPDDRWVAAVTGRTGAQRLVVFSRHGGEPTTLAELADGDWRIAGWIEPEGAGPGGSAPARGTTSPLVPRDTVWRERWTTLDTAEWRAFGDPASTFAAGRGPSGGGALLSSGDDLWPSGVVSRTEAELGDGITFEILARFRFTGEHWQEFEVGLMPQEGVLVGGERSLTAAVVYWWIAGPSPEYAEPQYACGTGADTKLQSHGWTLDQANAGWHRVGFTVRPDWTVTCYFDGEALGEFEVPASLRVPRAAIMLGGRTYKTAIYHGPFVVTRP